MDAIPVSFVLPAYTTVTALAPACPPLVRQILEARQALSTPAVQTESVLHYVGVLLTLLHTGGENAWEIVLSGATTLEWTTASQRTLRSVRLDAEIRLALSLLCSVLATRGEEAASQFRAPEAQATFTQCAMAFDILRAFLVRTANATAQRDEPRGRAIIARLFAIQSHYAALAHNKDKDQYAVGLGLAAAYWHLSQGELTRVPSCAALAAGYAHYLLMTCAINKAREIGDVDALGSNTAQVAHLEQLFALAAIEGQKAAVVFSLNTAMRDACMNCSKAAHRKWQQAVEARFKWILILQQKPTETERLPDDANALFASQILEDVFGVTPLPTPSAASAETPLVGNELWSRVMRAAQGWLILQGGRDSLRRALAPTTAQDLRRSMNPMDVPRQLLADIGVPDLALGKRDEVAVALGRMSERLQWLQHESSTVLALPGEVEELRASIAQLAALLIHKK
jgi:hypothetical protein